MDFIQNRDLEVLPIQVEIICVGFSLNMMSSKHISKKSEIVFNVYTFEMIKYIGTLEFKLGGVFKKFILPMHKK